MVTREGSAQARAVLDARTKQLGPAQQYSPPHAGWVRAMRDALGMSAAELGQRMNITGPAVSALERNEREGTARLETLRRAAEAMDCTLVYAFIPKQGLDEIMRAQAERLARQELRHVTNTMALEGQQVEVEDLLQTQTELLLKSGHIWAEQP